MSMKHVSVLLLLLQMSCCFRFGICGKVLVWPMEYSHWMNLNIILEELVRRGHEVIVLRNSASIFLDPSKQTGIKFENFPVSFTKDDLEDFFTQWVNKWTDLDKDSYWGYFPLMQEMFLEYSDSFENLCKEAVSNKKLMAKLQESKFDVLLSDAIGPCGELLAELLKIPFVYSLRFSPGHILEKYSGGLTLPPSYVPMILSDLSGKMKFMERVKNMLCMLYFDFWFQTFNENRWDRKDMKDK